jgi:hypothetical protein
MANQSINTPLPPSRGEYYILDCSTVNSVPFQVFTELHRGTSQSFLAYSLVVPHSLIGSSVNPSLAHSLATLARFAHSKEDIGKVVLRVLDGLSSMRYRCRGKFILNQSDKFLYKLVFELL